MRRSSLCDNDGMRFPDPKKEAARLTTPAELRKRAAYQRERAAKALERDLPWLLRDTIHRDALSQAAALEKRAARLEV